MGKYHTGSNKVQLTRRARERAKPSATAAPPNQEAAESSAAASIRQTVEKWLNENPPPLPRSSTIASGPADIRRTIDDELQRALAAVAAHRGNRLSISDLTELITLGLRSNG